MLVIGALNRREGPRAEAEFRVARGLLFVAHASAGFFNEGRESEVQDIREFISTIVSDPDDGR